MAFSLSGVVLGERYFLTGLKIVFFYFLLLCLMVKMILALDLEV
jgi:hypothetical protein